ncbi:MAG: methyltransferase domain-containing protein [Nitriliruptorales bacterium]|nr:methyltransferase domain-containing protein [Nitriliruptorales bacterium]
MGDQWRFDTEELFDEDYLYFYAGILTDEISDMQADLMWRLLELDRGSRVLDVACGHGRIANRLAAKGATVTGLDATPLFLDRARDDARQRGVEVDYVHGDMRQLPWESTFDAVTCVFTAFGYFDDAENHQVLHEVRKVLKPGGRLWIDVNNLPWLFANFRPEHVTERGGHLMIDRSQYHPVVGRATSRRTVVREGRQRTFEFSVRMFTFTELRDWLLEAGFTHVDGYSGQGEQLTADTPRMVVVGRV